MDDILQKKDFEFMQEEIKKTIKILKKGGIILYPTDTIWGIGCDARNKDAVSKIFNIKKREENKSLISLVCNKNMIDQFTDSKQLKISTTEKPTTVIYQDVNGLAMNLIANDNTAGFRITNDTFCNLLISSFGFPIVSTSANISGSNSPNQFSEISEEIKSNVDYIVNLRKKEIMKNPSDILFINPDGSITKLR